MLGLLGTVSFFSQISVGAWSEYTCINIYLEPKCYENNMIVVVSPSLTCQYMFIIQLLITSLCILRLNHRMIFP